MQNELRAVEGGNPTPFSLEQLPFIPRSAVEQNENNLAYLMFLLDHFLRATSNLVCLNRRTADWRADR